jgi:ketosteroid isomerase-like protein
MTISTEDHPNAVLARELWSATADGDAAALRRLFAENVAWRSYGQNPMSGEIHGPDAVLSYLATVGEQTDDLTSTLDCIFVNDEGAVIGFHISAVRGERRLEMDYLLAFRIEHGRAISAMMVPVDQATNDAFWT